MKRSTAVHDVAVYLAAVTGLALAIALAFPGTGSEEPGPAPVLTLFVPVVAVLATGVLTRARGHWRDVWRPVGFRPSGWRSWPGAVVLPVLVVVPGYAVAWTVGLCDFDGLGGHVPNVFLFLVVFSVVVLGEEIGWRGFLLPRLQLMTSRRRAAVLTGAAHGAFHLPLLLLTNGYDTEGSRWLVVPVAVAVITFGGVPFAWLRDRTGSIWPVAIAHAAVNACLLDGTDVLVTDHPAATADVAGEGGIITLLAVAAISLWLLRRPAFDDPAQPAIAVTTTRRPGVPRSPAFQEEAR